MMMIRGVIQFISANLSLSLSGRGLLKEEKVLVVVDIVAL